MSISFLSNLRAVRPTARVRVLLAALSLAPAAVGHAVQVGPHLDIPNVPLYVGRSVAPNLLVTLDTSTRTQNAYAPGSTAMFQTGITLASDLNTLYYRPDVTYTPPVNDRGIPYTTSFRQAYLNGFDPSRGYIDLDTEYVPKQTYVPFEDLATIKARDGSRRGSLGGNVHCYVSQYLREGGVPILNALGQPQCPGTLVKQDQGTRAYYWTYKADPAKGCPVIARFAEGADPPVDCFTFNRVPADQEQNFANWYSFYRTRNLAIASSAMLAFRDLPETYRVAWQTTGDRCAGDAKGFSSSCRGWDSRAAAVDARIAPFTSARKTDMWRWLARLPVDGQPVLRKALDAAGTYLQTTGPDSPYADNLGSPTTSFGSCRRSFSLMVSDGTWSHDAPPASTGNEDGSAKDLPDGRRYTPRAPYSDTSSATLADIAFRYWSTDLQPTLTNDLRTFMPQAANPTSPTDAEYWDPRNNPATWQHMTSFFVGVGVDTELRAAGMEWAGATFGGNPTPPYTGYWAIANGGSPWPPSGPISGNTYDLWHAAINGRGAFFSTNDSVGLTSALRQIIGRIDSQVVQRIGVASGVTASSLQVRSDTLAFTASYDSTRWDGTVRAYRMGSDGSPQTAIAWSTDTTLGFLGATRYTDASNRILVQSSRGPLIPLSDGNLPSMTAADRAALDAGATGLGVSTAALVKWILGDDSSTALRRRTRLLGDILGSEPVLENGRDYGYVETAWAAAADGTRTDGTVYASYVRSKSPGGTRYRPTLYFGANDGMLHALDAESGARRWAYLPSAMMGKIAHRASPDYTHDYFVDGPIALHDVHDGTKWRTVLVATFGAGGKGLLAMDVTDPDSPSLLWERMETDRGAGHILGEPVIARANDGTWIVAVGNGYGSTGNDASLKIFNVLTGAHLSTLTPRQPAATTAQGMSAPALLYLPGRKLGFAYAGDWQGNLWRFDLRDPSPSGWKVDNGGVPLFKARGPAGDVQPISAKPRVISDPSLGRVIVVGTGKLLELKDKDDLSVQTLYGVYDRSTEGTTLREHMTAQTITAQSATSRTVSYNALSKQAGWYLDYSFGAAGGERVVKTVSYLPELSLLLATSMRPSGSLCGPVLDSAVVALSPWSGAGRPVLTVGGASTAGARVSGMVTVPTTVRAPGGVSVLLNRGDQGVERIPMNMTWNPRAAWRQLR